MKEALIVFLVVIALLECPRWSWGEMISRAVAFMKTLFYAPLAAAAVVIGCVLVLDPLIINHTQNKLYTSGEEITAFGGAIGGRTSFWIALILIYFLSRIFKLQRPRALVIGTIVSSLLAGLLANIAKITFCRARPKLGEGAYSFFNYNAYSEYGGSYLSFSSGDVAVVSGAALFLFFAFKNYTTRWLLILPPLFTAYSRVYLNRHWPSDAAASLVLGLFAGALVDYVRSETFVGERLQRDF